MEIDFKIVSSKSIDKMSFAKKWNLIGYSLQCCFIYGLKTFFFTEDRLFAYDTSNTFKADDQSYEIQIPSGIPLGLRVHNRAYVSIGNYLSEMFLPDD